ncbi:MAG: hypothetical protein AAGF27_06720 [Pseudomonadota bacterium]
MFKTFQTSAELVEVTQGYGDVLSDDVAFFADIEQTACLSVTCVDTVFILANRRNKPSGHLQIIQGTMSTIPRGLAVMRHVMTWPSVLTLTTWVNDDEALADLSTVQLTALKSALSLEGWGLDVSGNVWTMHRKAT